MKFKLTLWIVAALTVMSLAACSGVTATVHFEADEQYNYLTISMTEEQTQELFAGILAESDDLPISNPLVDLHDGEIAISGDVPSGQNGTAPVSLIIEASSANGQPSLEVTSINFAGWEGTPDMLANINADIAANLKAAADNAKDGQLTEVSITEDALSFTLRGPRDQ